MTQQPSPAPQPGDTAAPAAGQPPQTRAARTATDVTDFIANLDAGLFEQKLGLALSQVAAGAMDHDRKGKITITLTFERLEGTFQCRVGHQLQFARPTLDGEAGEKEKRATVFHVGQYGALSIIPPDMVRGGQRTIPNT